MKIAQQSLEDMENAISLSLERSRGYGIDPQIAKAPESAKLTIQNLNKRITKQKPFFTIAKEQIDTLYALLQGSGFCMALADPDGYILYVVGDEDLVQHFISRNCMPGYRWTEKDLGTCAIGLTIVEKKPFFLPGNRMYAALAKSISNAAAPIFGVDQELLGVICLSGYSELMHIHTLGLVCQAAETVKSHLREHSNSRELTIKNQYMRALLEAGTKGIVTVDQSGNIVQTNRKACFLLDLPKDHAGKSFAEFVNIDFKLSTELKNGKGFLVREITSSKGKNFVSLAPVIIENGEMVGAILSITEKKEMVELAMEIAGAEAHFTFQSIIGKSSTLNSAMHVAKIAAKNDAPVLILGETGTGKELFAQAIHNASDRCDKPFIAINCGAIPKELLESELFGYEEGAFTGAQKGGRAGKFEIADTGTLFLDEIGDMPFDMQVKLLRVLQSGEIRRVGGLRTTRIDLRVISATNKDLRKEALFERFRPDLFYRISTLYLTVPPLRERDEDILMLIEAFMKRHGYTSLKDLLCPQAKKLLMEYQWPGNVRQLENTVERAIHLAQGSILKTEHFGLIELEKTSTSHENLSEIRSLDDIEQKAIKLTLIHHNGNLSQCAKSLGISRPTLYRKLEKFAIDLSSFS